ncbi:MAG TPA: hypothetical protein VI136_06790 [Verrucomicrobiae bacterium]
MSEFKFACPVCGQHITCDAANSGTPMECPTCFRKLVVPNAPADASSKFILSASLVPGKKPVAEVAPLVEVAAPAPRWLPFVWGGVTVLVLAGGALAAVKWGAVFKSHPRQVEDDRPRVVTRIEPPPALPAVPDPRWRLDLATVTIPDTPASGRIKGREFRLQRATIQNGTLALRQGDKWPPDVGVTILLPPRPPQDYAGKQFLIEPNFAGKAPRVVLRIKDEQGQEVTQSVTAGYAMKLEFNQAIEDRLPGGIYLCTPDEAQSVVVGSFLAEIRKPNPPKPPDSRTSPTNSPPAR